MARPVTPLIFLSLAAYLSGCPASSAGRGGAALPEPPPRPVPPRVAPTPKPPPAPDDGLSPQIHQAEAAATPGGRAVLAAARQLVAADTVVKGSCWDYANAVYTRAGFGGWRKQQVPFRSRTRGPYADPRLVQAGDWLYIINHAASLSTHSLIFVHWVDFARRRAMVITYVGGGREDPGMYRDYDISRIFQIIRPKIPQPKITQPKIAHPKVARPRSTDPRSTSPRAP